LSLCVFEKQNYIEKVVPEVQRFKFRHFGNDLVVLHERDISKELGAFKFFRNRDHKAAFTEDLTSMISSAPFTIISCCIDKRKLKERYTYPDNPYNISVQFCLERLYYFLSGVKAEASPCHVVFEGRGKKEDVDLELAFRRACDSNMTGRKFNFEPIIAPKSVNSTGLQIADLVSRPIGRHVINPSQPNRAYDVLATKFYRNNKGQEKGWGLKCFP
jgi:hypothetical protein